MDEHLLDDAPALAAKFARKGATVQTGLDRRRADRVTPVARDPPVRPLELRLARLQHVANERARASLQCELLGTQGEVHPGKDAPPDRGAAGRVAGPGTGREVIASGHQRDVSIAARSAP